jgi:cystathionine beta-lyase
VIPNANIREKWDTFTENLRVTNGNAFGYIAAEAAYTVGHAWYEEMKDIVYGNYQYVRETFTKELPDVMVSPLEGTYLAWIDMRKYVNPDKMTQFMQETCGLAFDYGDWFGGENFAGFIRMNLATKRENVEIAVEKIVQNLK